MLYIEDIDDKLEITYRLHSMLVHYLKDEPKDRRHLNKVCDTITNSLNNCVKISAINYTMDIIKRKGIEITECYTHKDGYVSIKDIGKFKIIEGNPRDIEIFRVYLLNRQGKYIIDILYKRKDMVGIDVGTAGRVFISSDNHIVKHLNVDKEIKLYLKTYNNDILKEIENKRDKVIYGLADYYTRHYSNIAIENLYTKDKELSINKELMDSKDYHTLDTRIKRQSWHKFFKVIEKDDKVDVLRVPPDYTSQICNACGYKDKKSRNKRIWKCKRCGHTDDSDVNAGKNIRDRGYMVMNNEEINLKQYRPSKKWRHKKRR